jgi:hypothetical protein
MASERDVHCRTICECQWADLSWYCNDVAALDELLAIPEIGRDPRSADNETIGQWGIPFYAGAHLRLTDGSIVGAHRILDPTPVT